MPTHKIFQCDLTRRVTAFNVDDEKNSNTEKNTELSSNQI